METSHILPGHGMDHMDAATKTDIAMLAAIEFIKDNLLTIVIQVEAGRQADIVTQKESAVVAAATKAPHTSLSWVHNPECHL